MKTGIATFFRLKVRSWLALACLLHGVCSAIAGLDSPVPADPQTYLAGVASELDKCWPTNRIVTIVCHGHSVVAGYFQTPEVRALEAYPALLRRDLCGRFPHAVFNVVVTAIGGENSEGGAARFARDVLALRPDVVTIDYALNDRGIGLGRAETAWRQMITNALAANVRLILLTPTADLNANLDDPADPLNQQAEQIRRLAAEYHVGLVDSLARFKAYAAGGGKLGDLMAQPNHPNGRGHALVAAELLPWFPAPAAGAVASAIDIGIDPHQLGRVFEGIGGVSAGASSRLLIDYPEPQRRQILDYLFKPNYGAALQHLKVEIGGDVNSTDGTEPSHERVRGELNFHRGYEWWLLQQAKARNPRILLDCLAWGAPGWIGQGNYDSQDMCDYLADFLAGARREHGLQFDFTGTRNESTVNPEWIKRLRTTLDARGLGKIQLVAADEWGGAWRIVTNSPTSVLTDSALSNAVARFGVHYAGSWSPPEAQHCRQPIWASEDGIGGSTWEAARKLARLYNRNYILGRMTKTEIWSPVTSYYDILAAPGSGLMRANTPWSGHYDVAPAVWATAHTTQFAQPGWTYLEGGASALLPAGGSLVTLLAPNHRDYSIVIETFAAAHAQTLQFHLGRGIAQSAVRIWQTRQDQFFQPRGSLRPVKGNLTFTCEPDSLYTLTTTSGQRGGSAQPPPARPFPLPYGDDFEDYHPTRTPKYFSDQAGAFEASRRADGSGACLRQVLTAPGIRWAAEWQPYTLLGDAAWRDYEVVADVLSETNRGRVFVLGRVGAVPGFTDPVPRGYWLALDGSRDQWDLHAGTNLLASGEIHLDLKTWHQLKLAMGGPHLRCFVDGQCVREVDDATYPAGMAGLGCGWHGAQFDHFQVQPLRRRP